MVASFSERQSIQPSSAGPDGLQLTVSDLNPISWSDSNDLQTDSASADVLLDSWEPGAESLPTHGQDLLRPSWSNSNDLQSWGNGTSTYPSMQPLQQGLDGSCPTTCAPIQPDWFRSDQPEQSTATAPGDPLTQTPSCGFVLTQPSWSDSNDLYHPDHYERESCPVAVTFGIRNYLL